MNIERTETYRSWLWGELALASLLRRHDFDVVGQAEDGEEAIARAAELQPQLVLLDLTMPGMDGLVALPQIR
ncbi:MAG: response regulator, partial [Gaiellaceae bacterium]